MTINNVTGTECPTDIAKLLQALIDQKSTIDLDNLSSTGEAKFTALQNAINTNSSSITTINKTLATKLSAEVSKAQNGYIKFSNNVILQWGTNVVYPDGQQKAVSYPISFKKFAIPVLTSINYSGDHFITTITNNYTISGFIPGTSSTSYRTFFWVSIGY